jgi:universal stress protein A
MLRPKNILVPTDFSEYSDKALKQALDIAKDYHSQVYLLHVIGEHTIQTVEEYSIDVEIIKQLDDQLLSNAKEKMQKELEKYNKSAMAEIKIIPVIRNGVPYEEILREADDKKVDLIVIASLGKTGLKKYFLGGVAQNVLKGSKCPVLLTKE